MRCRLFLFACLLGGFCDLVLAEEPPSDSGESAHVSTAKESDPRPWQDLFDGKTLKGWTVTNFGGAGDVTVEQGVLMLDFGDPLTGITYEGNPLPVSNYELRLEAKRVEGTDFFCGLTFPVQQSHCSLIVGGWGGALVGLSSIDGEDAARNDTSRTISFKRNTWYTIRVRVTNEAIQAWLNDDLIVQQPLAGRAISIRPEVSLSRPLGIASFQTRAALRNIQLRQLD